jgi:indolepyruvate ferredoxin oxidoreductase beta subunit
MKLSIHSGNIRFAGLGGTGVIKASDIFADVVFRLGYDVKKAEVHGMSQRGGSLSSDVRWGASIDSPMISDGECDLLVVMEATQVVVAQGCLKQGGILLQPSDIEVDKLPSVKALNVAMLGRMSTLLDFPEDVWQAALQTNFPEKLWSANEKAFALGRGVA